MTYADIRARVAAQSLEIFGGFHPVPQDSLPPDIATLLLLGPREPGFWDHVTASDEFRDGAPDPMDRWSRRVIGTIACDLGGKAYFPFGGPPWHPFIAWATRTGRAWASPVAMMVHDTAGLMVSYRGALGLRERIVLLEPGQRPCESCEEKPCLAACPVAALTEAGYDVPGCKSYLNTPDGGTCMTGGCLVRRACPVSKRYGRLPEQSAFHMMSFL